MTLDFKNAAILEKLERARAKAKIKQVDWPDRHIIGKDGKPVPFHRAQNLAWDSPRRIVVLSAGTQSGKCGRFSVLLADGRRVLVKDIIPGDKVLSLGENLRITENVVTDSFCTGVQGTYRVTTASGRRIVVTKDHPLYSQNGWRPAGEFSVGDFIGVPRRLPDVGKKQYDHDWMKILGYLLGDGGLTRSSPMFSNADAEILADISRCLPHECSLKHSQGYNYRITTGRRSGLPNPVSRKCREWGIWGKLAKHKRIPEFVFELRKSSIAPMLSALFSCDGTVDKTGIEIALASEGMIDDIQHLLLRFGIVARKKYKLAKYLDKAFDSWRLAFRDRENLRTFRDEIGFIGEKREKLDALIEKKETLRPNRKDLVLDFPRGLCWSALGPLPHPPQSEYLDKVGYELLRNARRGSGIARSFAQKISRHFGVGEQEATSDIYWDRVDSIEPLGEDTVWDITVENGHNFIADDFFAHNTAFSPWWLRREIQRGGGGDYLAVTSSFSLFKKKFLPQMLLTFEHILGWGRFWTGDQIIELKDPSTGDFLATRSTDPMWARIILCSAQSVGGLESATAKAAVLDEAGQDEFVVDAYHAITRRLSLNRGRKLIATTLYNSGWMKSLIIDPANKGGTVTSIDLDSGAEIEVVDNEASDICLIQYDSIVNPEFSVEEFEKAREELPPDIFSMFYRGRLSKPRHLIYDCLEEETHVIPRFEIPADWQRYMGLDFGGMNTAATLWAEDPQSRKLYCYREYKAGGRSAKEHVEAMLEGEPMLPLCWGGAKAEGQWRQEFRDGGLSVKQPRISDVWLGIQTVYAEIKSNNLFVFDDLPLTLNDLLTYRRKYDDQGNPMNEIHNKNTFHMADAIRYLVSSIRKHRSALVSTA